ncbi:DUF6191 domain-containing protein [Streptomyces sp. A5-4]|uniref:DUF6191 domain-containing protein n=1 Tax=Streptomyces sp. A5-4 TaxID=3384771 RepID=UPI003DA88FBD
MAGHERDGQPGYAGAGGRQDPAAGGEVGAAPASGPLPRPVSGTGCLPWREGPETGGHLLEEFFAPGRKHTDDERERLVQTRVDLGDSDPGRGRIDLTSGKVVIRLPDPPDPSDDPGPARP